MKIALVHDYLREYGGAERVVEVLHELYPDAPLYTAFVDWNSLGEFADRFRNWDIRTAWVDRNPLVKRWHSPLRFLTPLVWESINLKEFDVVISSSGWYICRGVITQPHQVHISYIHHPPRNLYGYSTGAVSQGVLARTYATFINPFLRIYDYAAAQRVDHLIANSETTRQRIKKFYRRDAEVIYPPITMSNVKYQMSKRQGRDQKYFLSVGRLTYAKRIDVLIEACNELKLPLKIVGTGREEGKLKALAGPTIEFVGAVSDEELQNLYSRAKGLIFCALEEDFGMVPVEAMSYGVPIIALKQGGVRETVMDGKTGLLFESPTPSNLIEALKRFEKTRLDPQMIHKHAQKFSKEVFKKKIKEFVEEKYKSL